MQHGARLDDELAEGTEGLTTGAPISARERADLDPEAPTLDELDISATRPDLDVAAPAAIVARSELAIWLLPSSFPGDAGALLADAQALDAPDDVIELLTGLDPTMRFEAFGEVWRALGGAVETREHPDAGVAADEVPVAHREVTVAREPVVVPPEAAIPASAPSTDEPGGNLVGTAVGIVTIPLRVTVAVVRELFHVGRVLLGRDG